MSVDWIVSSGRLSFMYKFDNNTYICIVSDFSLMLHTYEDEYESKTCCGRQITCVVAYMCGLQHTSPNRDTWVVTHMREL